MDLRTASAADLPRLAAMAAPLQARPERHIVYLSTDASGIEAELRDLTWQVVSVVASDASTADDIAGWMIGDVDEELGRVWWNGPFVRADDWQPLADGLLAEGREQLPSNITEEEMAVDAKFDGFEIWAEGHGFAAGRAAWILTLDGDLDEPIGVDGIEYRLMTEADHPEFARIHDEQFAGTHSTGTRLIAQHDADHPRIVAASGGSVVGYIAVERQPDGGGYIDFVGVDPPHRRRGIGGGLVRAGVGALKAAGAEPVHLTVREDIAGARELYASLGFTEERLAVPFRRGFGVH